MTEIGEETRWLVKVKDRQLCIELPKFLRIDESVKDMGTDDLLSLIILQTHQKEIEEKPEAGLFNMKHCCLLDKIEVHHCCMKDWVKHCCVKDII